MRKSRRLKSITREASGTAGRAFCCVVSALLARLCFPGPGLSFLAWFCLVPFILVLLSEHRRKQGFFLAFVFGCAYFALVLDWFSTFSRYSGPWAVYGGWLVYAVYHGLFFALFMLLFLVLFQKSAVFGPRARTILGIFAFSFCWALFDGFRSVSFHANTLGGLCYSQYRSLRFLQAAAYAGSHGLTFLIVCVNALIAFFLGALLDKKRKMDLWLWLVLAVAAAAAAAFLWREGGRRLDQEPFAKPFRVAVYQPNISQSSRLEDHNNPAFKKRILLALRSLGKKTAPDLIVMPETVVLEFLLEDKAFIFHLASGLPCDLLFGTPRMDLAGDGGLFHNSVVLMDRYGRIKGYHDKKYLVPMYEYDPLPGLFKDVLGLCVKRKWQYAPGTDTAPVAGVYAVSVCFESTLPGPARRLVDQGARLIVVATNDAWFRGTRFPEQHLAFAVMRAVENGRFLVQAANSGISAVVDGHGRIIAETREDDQTWLVALAGLVEEKTFYTRAGEMALYAGLVFLAALSAALFMKQRILAPARKRAGKRRRAS